MFCIVMENFPLEFARTHINASKSGSQGRTGLKDKILCGHFVDRSTKIELADSKSVFKIVV